MTQGAEARFVGRERELAVLVDALGDANDGNGRLVLVSGEPGIGKSRLADELVRLARARNHGTVWGQGWEDAGAPPYWPWIQVLRPIVKAATDEDLRGLLGRGAGDVAQILPELRARLPDLPGAANADSESARFQLFDSTAAFLRAAAEKAALVIVLDDLHAVDLASIRFLGFLGRQLAGARLLVIGTYRDVELAPGDPISTELEGMARGPAARSLRLSGLEPSSVGELVAGLSGGSRDSMQPPGMAAAMWQATGGNPLFVGEAVRLLSSDGTIQPTGGAVGLRVAVPPGIGAAISRRIATLHPDVAGALRLGATLGPEFSLDLLARVGDLDPQAALRAADDATAAGLLLPAAGVPGRHRFAHALVRETLYGELGSADRARIHRRAAEEIEAGASASTTSRAPELAFHFGQALAGADLDQADRDRLAQKAAGYARQAGAEATATLAFEEAARQYRSALAALDTVQSNDREDRIDILLSLGDVLGRAGDLAESRTAFHDAAQLARRSGDGRRLALAALGFPGRSPWARQGRETRVVPLLDDALAVLGSADIRLRIRLLARLACALRSVPDRRAESDSLSGEAVELARSLGDAATLDYAITGRYWATWWPENPETRIGLAREAVLLAQELGDGERIIDARLMAFQSLVERGLMREATAAMDHLSDAIRDLRQPAQLWLEPANRALLALIRGDLGAADALIAEQHEVGPRLSPGQDHVIAARMHTFLLRREQGRAAETEADIRASIEDVPWYPFHRAALACLLLDAGRPDDAQAVLDALAEERFRALYRDNEWLLGMCLAAEAAGRLGDVAAAEELSSQLAPFEGRHAVGHAEGSVGAVDRALGLLASARGRLDDAVRHLDAAVAVNDAMSARGWAAHSRHELATVLRRRGHPGDDLRADALDAEALEAADQLGMALADELSPITRATAIARRDPARPTVGPRPEVAFLHRDGEYWSVQFGHDSFSLRDSKGLHHLAKLLTSPGREIHALELAQAGAAPSSRTSRHADPDEDLHSGLGDAGAMLDAEAKAAYRHRLAEIQEDLAEAERWNDPERVALLRDESDALTHELSAALGLGGRDRVAASPSERARLSVTRAIRSALARVSDQSPAAGAHLDATIRTGTFCSYSPDPRAPIEWRV